MGDGEDGRLYEGAQERDSQACDSLMRRREGWVLWHGILFEEPNPTGSRPRDLIGLYEQQRKTHPPNTQERARAATERRSGRNGAKGMRRNPPEMGTGRRRPRKPRGGRKERRTQTEQGSRRVGWRNSRGSAAARPTLTRDWVGTRVKDPIPIVSVDPTEDQPRPEGAEERNGPIRRKGAG